MCVYWINNDWQLRFEFLIPFVQYVNETGRENATSFGIALDITFHPVLVFRLFNHDHKDFTFTERYFVVIVRLTIVERPATSTLIE